MTVNDYLMQATRRLLANGIATARLDCLVLLEDATGKDRASLLAQPELILQGSALKQLTGQIERRARHEPLAYIRGKSEFYGREFIVSKDTLDPRPETETMISLLKKILNSQNSPLLENSSLTEGRDTNLLIVDVGTGSGCLAIAAKLQFPNAQVAGTDISPACLKIAHKNAKKLGADITFYQGDLLEPLPTINYQLSTILLANLPYVPDDHTINRAAMYEPKVAIFGGPDGLNLYRKLFVQISKADQKPVFVFTESLPPQHAELRKTALQHGYQQVKEDDFIQVFKS